MATSNGGKFLEQFSTGGLEKDTLRYMLKSKASSNESVEQFFRTTNPALYEVVRMCSVEKLGIPRVVSFLTTNLDSLIQVCDRAIHGSPRRLRTIERASKSTETYKIPLYHLHGYLTPFENEDPKKEAADRLIITEQEYNARTDQPRRVKKVGRVVEPAISDSK